MDPVCPDSETETKTNEKSDSIVHMLPCKIEFDGPAPVNAYFHMNKKPRTSNNKSVSTQNNLESHFRGRKLEGVEFELPKNIIGMYTHTSQNISHDGTADINIEGTFHSINVWEHDRPPTTHIAQLEECISWFELAEAVSNIKKCILYDLIRYDSIYL